MPAINFKWRIRLCDISRPIVHDESGRRIPVLMFPDHGFPDHGARDDAAVYFLHAH